MIEENFKPNNNKLLTKIKTFQANQCQEAFMEVIKELQGENAFLLVPTNAPISDKNEDENTKKGWKTLEKGAQLTFSSVFEVEGKLVIGVFTSQAMLMSWASETKPYVTLPAKEVLEIALQNNISQIIIDSNQDTMFVLGRTV